MPTDFQIDGLTTDESALVLRLLTRYSPASTDFFSRAGVTSPSARSAVDNLFRTIQGQGLWANAWVAPMKSAQNAGTGSTVYAAGGWRQNSLTLVNSPTWGVSGIALNGSTQYAANSTSDWSLAPTQNQTVFVRATVASKVANSTLVASRYSGGAFAGWQFRTDATTGFLRALNYDGTNADTALSAVDVTSASSTCFVAEMLGSYKIWTNTTDVTSSVSKLAASYVPQTTELRLGGTTNSAPDLVGTLTGVVILNTSTTSTQRVAITNALNAL